jgi:polysaccharide pyruvyl transferase WcaK-like protein
MIITRNEESQTVLGKLGVATELGTDTAWTFEPHPVDFGRNVLRKAGWDGVTPVLVVCPVNPFWWPVKPSLLKLTARKLTGAYKDSHYRSIYFHNSGPEVDRKYDASINAISNAVDRFRNERKVFVVLCATERLDIDSCKRMSAKLGGIPYFSSAEYNMYELVSILRATHLMVSSRFHGIVTCMPHMVPSAGVTIDERIKNLMRERDHSDLLLIDDDPQLEDKLVVIMGKLMDEQDRIRDGIGKTVARNLKVMAKMGVFFEEQLMQVYPDFPRPTGVRTWEDYLPPMSPTLLKLMESYG